MKTDMNKRLRDQLKRRTVTIVAKPDPRYAQLNAFLHGKEETADKKEETKE